MTGISSTWLGELEAFGLGVSEINLEGVAVVGARDADAADGGVIADLGSKPGLGRSCAGKVGVHRPHCSSMPSRSRAAPIGFA